MKKAKKIRITETFNSSRTMVLVLALTIFGITNFGANNAFAATTEWNSDISVGIIDSEYPENEINLKVTTYSNNGLSLVWDEPNLSDNLVVVGYQILRKTLDSDYITIVDNTPSTETSYIDDELAADYYGYKIVPITEHEPSDQVTMHGIDRNNNLFNSYLAGQELLAQYTLNEILNEKSIQNNFSDEPITYYSEFLKRSEDPVLQRNIALEILKAEQIFNLQFNIEINH